MQNLVGSERIYDLRPVSFNEINVGDRVFYGLIAEEVEGVVPEAVIYQNRIPKSIEYRSVFIMMLPQIQKLRNEVDELKARTN
ncbi:MAG: tail fiber domain-containing protein [Verrucomicrobia bacterium]|nr:tail fiber domain-containing protein [Verrucomicrobiota bacterium]